jgi:hypothetical protein
MPRSSQPSAHEEGENTSEEEKMIRVATLTAEGVRGREILAAIERAAR